MKGKGFGNVIRAPKPQILNETTDRQIDSCEMRTLPEICATSKTPDLEF